MTGRPPVALVTGGGSGIGATVAGCLAQRGASVAVADRDKSGAEEVAGRLQGKGFDAIALAVDVRDEPSVSAAVDALTRWRGPLSWACNAAAIGSAGLPVVEWSLETWRSVCDTNLTGVWLSLKHEALSMRAHGSGRIVNIASVAGHVGLAGSAGYVAAKHGVIGLTKVAAVDLAASGICVNAVSPGATDTPLLDRRRADGRLEAVLSRQPMPRLARPIEIAEVVAWLCADAPDFLTGASIPVDGGWLAQ